MTNFIDIKKTNCTKCHYSKCHVLSKPMTSIGGGVMGIWHNCTKRNEKVTDSNLCDSYKKGEPETIDEKW